MEERYRKLLDMDRPELDGFPRMSMYDRAAQFSPFSALRGFEDETDETGRQTDELRGIDESLREIIDRKIQVLSDILDTSPQVEITHFVPDETKDGGRYVCSAGKLKKIDAFERKLVLEDGSSVDVSSVSDIYAPIFDRMGL